LAPVTQRSDSIIVCLKDYYDSYVQDRVEMSIDSNQEKSEVPTKTIQVKIRRIRTKAGSEEMEQREWDRET
jgi:hypothetical protein